MTPALVAQIVHPAGELPPWLMLVTGAVLFVGGLVVYFGGRRRVD